MIQIERNKKVYIREIERINRELKEINIRKEDCNVQLEQTNNTDSEVKSICPICYSQESDPRTKYSNCHENCHGVCLDCFDSTIDHAFNDGEYPAKCPHRCGGTLLADDFKKFTNLNLKQFHPSQIDRYRILMAHAEARKYPNELIFCKGEGCFNFTRIQEIPQDHHFDCTLCSENLCISCGYDHVGMSCETALKTRKGDEEFFKLIDDPSSNVRPCPYCSTPTFKYEACDHMGCNQCKNIWDWKLGKIQGPVHYSRTDGSEPRLYRVSTDINPDTNEPYGEYKENVN